MIHAGLIVSQIFGSNLKNFPHFNLCNLMLQDFLRLPALLRASLGRGCGSAGQADKAAERRGDLPVLERPDIDTKVGCKLTLVQSGGRPDLFDGHRLHLLSPYII